MKAVRFHEHGGVEVLKYEDAPEPRIQPDEVLVSVRACALNHLDLWVRDGLPGMKLTLPHILGADISGEVAEVGSVVRHVKPGDRVLLCPGISCGNCPACFRGLDSICRSYTAFGSLVDGGYAEYVKSPRVNVIPIPWNIGWSEAAAVPLVFLTAWHMLVGRVNLRAGEDVLVIGAGSGVGSAAIQIAKMLGARVIATAGSEEKLAKARALGADDLVNHSRPDMAQEVRRLTQKRGVDVVFEHVGPAVWDACFHSLASNGRLVTCGATTGPEVKIDLRALFARHRSLFGSYMGNKAELLEVLKFVFAGKLHPVIDSTFPLHEAAAAQKRMEERQNFGKIILEPSKGGGSRNDVRQSSSVSC